MEELISALQGDRPPGLYTIGPDTDLATLSSFCETQDWRLVVLDGRTITNKATFLQASAQAFQFPSYFGQNWDAFEDCLTDLDWLPGSGYVLLYTHPEGYARAHPGSWATLLAIFRDAVQAWQKDGKPFYVFFQSQDPVLAEVEAL